MKEMVYQTEPEIEVLNIGFYFGFLYYIINLGTHPTAYVKIPENHRYYKKQYDEIDIAVHGGLTYSEPELYIEDRNKVKGWFIGWDYAHYGDYMGYYENTSMMQELKKWTTQEIQQEVKSVCYQLEKAKEE